MATLILKILPLWIREIGAGFVTSPCAACLVVLVVLSLRESGGSYFPASLGVYFCSLVEYLNAPGIAKISGLN